MSTEAWFQLYTGLLWVAVFAFFLYTAQMFVRKGDREERIIGFVLYIGGFVAGMAASLHFGRWAS